MSDLELRDLDDRLHRNIGDHDEVVAIFLNFLFREMPFEGEKAKADQIVGVGELLVGEEGDSTDVSRPGVVPKVDGHEEIEEFAVDEIKKGIELVGTIVAPNAEKIGILVIEEDGGEVISGRVVDAQEEAVASFVCGIFNPDESIDFHDWSTSGGMIVVELEGDGSDIVERRLETEGGGIEQGRDNLLVDGLRARAIVI